MAGCSRHPTDVRPSRADGPRAEAARWIAAAGAAMEGRMPRPDVVASCGVRPGRARVRSASADRSGVAVGRARPVTRSAGTRMARPTGTMRARCTTWRVHVLRFRSLVDRPERCAGRILENVALYSPGTGTYAPTDNVVKSDRRSPRRVRSHGNSPISGLLRMVAVSRSSDRARRSLQIDLEPVAWPAIPRVALALLPTEPLRRRTSELGTPSQTGDVAGGARTEPRRIMNRTPRPGAPPRAVPDTHAPRRRRAVTWAIAALTATAVLVAGALIAMGQRRRLRCARARTGRRHPLTLSREYTRPADWRPTARPCTSRPPSAG